MVKFDSFWCGKVFMETITKMTETHTADNGFYQLDKYSLLSIFKFEELLASKARQKLHQQLSQYVAAETDETRKYIAIY